MMLEKSKPRLKPLKRGCRFLSPVPYKTYKTFFEAKTNKS
jgi:hypothetical protein